MHIPPTLYRIQHLVVLAPLPHNITQNYNSLQQNLLAKNKNENIHVQSIPMVKLFHRTYQEQLIIQSTWNNTSSYARRLNYFNDFPVYV